MFKNKKILLLCIFILISFITLSWIWIISTKEVFLENKGQHTFLAENKENTLRSMQKEDYVFFDATKEIKESFVNDIFNQNLEENKKRLKTNIDGYITPDNYLRINYISNNTSSSKSDYTIVGEGGGNSLGVGANYMIFKMLASEENFAEQFCVEFYCGGNSIGKIKFSDWLAKAGYTSNNYAIGQIDSNGDLKGEFKEYKLPLKNIVDVNNLQGIKLKFNKGNSNGLILIDYIKFDNNTFDKFNYSTSRGNYYKDDNKNLPFVRTPESKNGSYAGYNYGPNMMWTASSISAGIVNDDDLKDEKTLKIKYNGNINTYAKIISSSVIENENVLGITLKGNTEINNLMNVVLYDGDKVVAKMPLSNFVTNIDGEEKAQISNEYSTFYINIDKDYKFDTVAFEFEKSKNENISVKVKNVFFPRIEYSVHYFYDGEEDISKVETKFTKYKEKVDKFDPKNKDNYVLDKVEGLPLTVSKTAENNIINVYYKKKPDNSSYTVEYYYDDIIDSSKTSTVEAEVGSVINFYENKEKDGYVLDKVEGLPLTVSKTLENNIIKVYYKTKKVISPEEPILEKATYKIEYYYDGIIDSNKTVSKEVKIGTVINFYENKSKDGYILDKIEGLPLTVSENGSNTIKVFYKKEKDENNTTIKYDKDKTTSSSRNLPQTGKMPIIVLIIIFIISAVSFYIKYNKNKF